jgi:peptide/nickel transport system substrate-binding protein
MRDEGRDLGLTRKNFLRLSGSSLVVVLAGCGSSSKPGAAAGGLSQLSVAVAGGPDTLDTHTTIAGTDWVSLANIYDGLFMRDYASPAQPARTIPGLATAYDISPDGRTYTFELRKNVKFHDGTPWDSEAALFNFRRWFDKSFEFYYGRANATVSPFIGGVADYDAPDASTFRVQLEKVNAGWFDYFTGAPTFFMVSPAAVQESGNEGFANKGIGTGPFVVKEYERNARLVLESNASYWGGAPAAKKLVIVPVPDEAARVSGVLSGQYDIGQEIPPDGIAQVEKNPNMQLKFAGKPVTFGFGGDNREGPWSDPAVRQAVSLAINRQGITDGILRGSGVPASQFYGLGNPAYDSSLQPLPYDQAKAKQTLQGSDYSSGLTFKFLTSTSAMGVPDPPRVLEQVQSDLDAIGISSSIQVVEWTAYLGRWGKGTPAAKGNEVPIYTQAMGWDTNMLLISYAASASQPPGGVNFVWYDSPKVDSELDAGTKSKNPDDLLAHLRAAQQQLLQDQPYTYVFHGKSPYVIRKGIDWTPANTWAQRFSKATVA